MRTGEQTLEYSRRETYIKLQCSWEDSELVRRHWVRTATVSYTVSWCVVRQTVTHVTNFNRYIAVNKYKIYCCKYIERYNDSFMEWLVFDILTTKEDHLRLRVIAAQRLTCETCVTRSLNEAHSEPSVTTHYTHSHTHTHTAAYSLMNWCVVGLVLVHACLHSNQLMAETQTTTSDHNLTWSFYQEYRIRVMQHYRVPDTDN